MAYGFLKIQFFIVSLETASGSMAEIELNNRILSMHAAEKSIIEEDF